MNAVIKITGVQGFMQPDAETVEFVTDGVYCRTEDGYQIFYHESALTGLAGTSTTVDITCDAITVERKGVLNTKWCSARARRTGSFTIRASEARRWALKRARSPQALTITAEI